MLEAHGALWSLFWLINEWRKLCPNHRAVGDALVLDFGLQLQQILMEMKSMNVKENISQGRGLVECAVWMELCNKKPSTFIMS
ncbi:hypothetical protein CRYUN_Cryun33cG0093700 [Craigia yunnanensis]